MDEKLSDKEHDDRMAAAMAITMLANSSSSSTKSSNCSIVDSHNLSHKVYRKGKVGKVKLNMYSKSRKKKEKNKRAGLDSLDEIFTAAIDEGNELAVEISKATVIAQRNVISHTLPTKNVNHLNLKQSFELRNRRLPPKKRKVVDMEVDKPLENTAIMQQNMVLPPEDSNMVPSVVAAMKSSKNVLSPTAEPIITGTTTKTEKETAAQHFQLVDPCRNMHILKDYQKAVSPDEDGDLSLHIAVVQGSLPMVQRLIELMKAFNKSIDTYNKLRQTALHLSILTQDMKIIELLLKSGANPNITDRNGRNCLHLAMVKEKIDIAKLIMSMSEFLVDLDAKTFEGLTVLHMAVEKMDRMGIEPAELMINSGCDLNAEDSKSGRTSLHYAVENNNTTMTKLLLRKGADPNLASYAGINPFQIASNRGYAEIRFSLQAAGANINASTGSKLDFIPAKKGKKQAEIPALVSAPLKIPIPRLSSIAERAQPFDSLMSENSEAILPETVEMDSVTPAIGDNVDASKQLFNVRDKSRFQNLNRSLSLNCDSFGHPLPIPTDISSNSIPPDTSKAAKLPSGSRSPGAIPRMPIGKIRLRMPEADVKDLRRKGVNVERLIQAMQKGDFATARQLMQLGISSRNASNCSRDNASFSSGSKNQSITSNLIPSVISSASSSTSQKSQSSAPCVRESRQGGDEIQKSSSFQTSSIKSEVGVYSYDHFKHVKRNEQLHRNSNHGGKINCSQASQMSVIASQLRSSGLPNFPVISASADTHPRVTNSSLNSRPIMAALLNERNDIKANNGQTSRAKPVLPFANVPFMGHNIPMMMSNNYSVAYAPVLIPNVPSHGLVYPYSTLSNTLSVNQAPRFSHCVNSSERSVSKLNRENTTHEGNKSTMKKVVKTIHIKKELASETDSDTIIDYSLPKEQDEPSKHTGIDSKEEDIPLKLQKSCTEQSRAFYSPSTTETEKLDLRTEMDQLKQRYNEAQQHVSNMPISVIRHPTPNEKQCETRGVFKLLPKTSTLPISAEDPGCDNKTILTTDSSASQYVTSCKKPLHTLEHLSDSKSNDRSIMACSGDNEIKYNIKVELPETSDCTNNDISTDSGYECARNRSKDYSYIYANASADIDINELGELPSSCDDTSFNVNISHQKSKTNVIKDTVDGCVAYCDESRFSELADNMENLHCISMEMNKSNTPLGNFGKKL